MEAREEMIRLWFDMWLRGEDFGVGDVFTEDAVYTESWGPVYHGSGEIGRWFHEWNMKGRVLLWDIHRFFHNGDQTVVTWYFQCQMEAEAPTGFEGTSLICWAENGKIATLTEYGCDPKQYDPYDRTPSQQGLSG